VAKAKYWFTEDNDYIWVHHCDFFYGDAGGDADQGERAMAHSCQRSTYVTFAYNNFGIPENRTSRT
jgi:pectate lyase